MGPNSAGAFTAACVILGCIPCFAKFSARRLYRRLFSGAAAHGVGYANGAANAASRPSRPRKYRVSIATSTKAAAKKAKSPARTTRSAATKRFAGTSPGTPPPGASRRSTRAASRTKRTPSGATNTGNVNRIHAPTAVTAPKTPAAKTSDVFSARLTTNAVAAAAVVASAALVNGRT